jgi:hypothetical protein
MRGYLLAFLCVLLIAAPVFAAPVSGQYSGSVRHNFSFHNITTTINSDGNGNYLIDDDTFGTLTRVGKVKDGDLYQWRDRWGNGYAVFRFNDKSFGGYWCYPNTLDYQRFKWSGKRHSLTSL